MTGHYLKPIRKTKYLLLPFIMPILVAGIIVFFITGCNGDLVKRPIYHQEIRHALLLEFDMIEIMPNAIAIKERRVGVNDNHVFIGNIYDIDATYLEILEHYDRCLQNNGWEFIREENIYDWFSYYGGKTVYYKKDEYVATVHYSGDVERYGWTYSFSMSWGLYRELE